MNIFIDEKLRGILKKRKNLHYFRNIENLKLTSNLFPLLIIIYVENNKFDFSHLKKFTDHHITSDYELIAVLEEYNDSLISKLVKNNVLSFFIKSKNLSHYLEKKIDHFILKFKEKESSNKFLYSLINSADDFYIFSLDKDLKYTFLSESYKKFIKRERGVDLKIGMKAFSTIRSKNKKLSLDKKIKESLVNNQSFSMIEKFKSKHKKELYFETKIYPIIKNNEIAGFTGVIKDITKEKETAVALKESEEKYREIFNNEKLIMLIVDFKMQNIVGASLGALKFLGWTKEELFKMKISDINTLPLEETKKRMKFLKENKVQSLKFYYKTKNRGIKEVEIIRGDFFLKGREYFYLLINDITERKKIEISLTESEEKFRAITNSAADAIILIDDTGKVIFWNSAAERIFGYKWEEIEGNDFHRMIVPKKYFNQFTKGFKKFKKTGKGNAIGKTIELTALNKKGIEFPISLSISAVIINNKWHSIGIVRDITERKKIEEKLKENEEKYRSIFNTTPDALSITDTDGTYLEVNRSFELITGFKKEEVIGKKAHEIGIWYSPEEREKFAQNLYKYGELHNLEIKFRKKDGSPLIGLISSKLVNLKGKTIILSIARNITERKKMEEQILKEREQLLVTLRSIGDGVITTDKKGKIVLMNKIAEKLTGWKQSEAIGEKIENVFKIYDEFSEKKIKNPVKEVLKRGIIFEAPTNTILISKNCNKRKIDSSASPIKDKESKIIGAVLVFRDITEKEKLLEATQKNQKLEALGILAGGIAHDFNNLLSGIFGYIELAYIKAKTPQVSSYLEKTMSTLEKARSLTKQLLTFSKGGAPVKRVDSIFPLVKETVEFLLSGSEIKAEFFVDENLWEVNYDKYQIGQVIDNIIINSIQAMPNGVKITIKAENVLLNRNQIITLPEGKYVRLTFKDEGIGIPKNIISRIFDPFFTTKNKGHGLGLATSYSIIKKHNGEIIVESEPGEGTVFKIYLPASHSKKTKGVKRKKNILKKGSGTIIVMDDEDVVRETIKEMLITLGFSVVETTKGEEVLNFLKEKNIKDLKGIILDLTITGGMGGKETVAEIRKIDKHIPVFVASGYASDPIIANPEKFGFSASTEKPFKIKELNEMLFKYIK